MNPVEIAALDALDLLVVVDNESDTLSSVDKGVPQLPEPREHDARFGAFHFALLLVWLR